METMAKTTQEVGPSPLTTVNFKVRLEGTKLRIETFGSIPATVQFNFYKAGSLPRYNGKILPVVPNFDPVFNVVAQTGDSKTVHVPEGNYDVLVLLNDRPVGASSVSISQLNGPLGKALLLLSLGAFLLMRG